jgi:hypothetical protein
LSDDDRNLTAFGPCFIHGGIFHFDPETVISVWIDPVTNRPPDVNEDGSNVDPLSVGYAESSARAIQQPICPACVSLLNRDRVTRGKSPIRQVR